MVTFKSWETHANNRINLGISEKSVGSCDRKWGFDMQLKDSLSLHLARALGMAGLCGLLFTGLPGGAAMAQSSSGVTPDQLQMLQQMQQQMKGGNNAQQTIQPPVSRTETILEPTSTSAPQGTTDLERILSARAGTKLQQFGYDQFGQGRPVTQSQVGAVQDRYILGVGDEIVLTLRGQENMEYRAEINRDGSVVFPKLNPVPAAGQSFGKFRSNLLATVRRSFVSTEAFVTVGRVRQISVLVSGEVSDPGVRTLTGLSTVVDALLVSGGIKKSGSLRSIQIVRGDRILTVDLYSVMIGRGAADNAVLTEGDKIVVPPLGRTLAVAGNVRRPGIYELPPGARSVSVHEAMRLANGTTVPGSYTISLMQMQPDGKRRFIDVTGARNAPVADGEVVLVRTAVDVSINQVQLTGAVRTPGSFALGKYATLHDVLPSMDVLQPGAYTLMGVIDRMDPATLQRSALPFSPLHVVQGKENVRLMSDDSVRILTKVEMRKILAAAFARDRLFKQEFDQSLKDELDEADQKDDDTGKRVRGTNAQGQRGDNSRGSGQQGGGQDYRSIQGGTSGNNNAGSFSGGDMTSADTRSAAGSGGSSSAGLSAGPSGAPAAGDAGNSGAPGQGDMSAADGAFFGKSLSDYWVNVSGAVHAPGFYLVAPGTTMEEVLAAIGGLVDDVDSSEFELTSTVIDNSTGRSTTSRSAYPATREQFAKIVVAPFDRVHFRRVYSDKYSGSVKVDGEVRYPGVYSILRNEKLSSVLQRAGGMTDVAFPEGAVFLRDSVAEAEQDENRRVIADMRNQMLALMVKPSMPNAQAPNGETLKAMEVLMTELEQNVALGRVPVTADPAALQKHPDLDTALESGDSITIPKKPATVLVMGEVMRSGAQRFEASNSVDDYIERAGGTTQQADTSRIIIVLPDGSVRSNSNSWLNFGFGSKIPVGSTVFVPRELDPYTVHQFVVDTVQIFAQLATSAAALAVLSKQ
jgi:protein involved in polysaccharide export with SLBB domain